MRLVFLGTPAEAVPALRALHAAGHDIAVVVTQPDRRRGRGGALVPSSVRTAAEDLGLPVLTPARAREVVDEVAAAGAELGVVVAFGQLLPPALLASVRRGFLNVHFSLLPRWRGAAPVERAILAGDAGTGVCIMGLEEGLDTGPVYACTPVAIGPEDTAGELRARLVDVGTPLLLDVVSHVADIEPAPQEGEPTYAAKLDVAEFELDPAEPADNLARRVRAGNPRPGAWLVRHGTRVKVWRSHAITMPAVADLGSVTTDLGDPVLVTAHGGLVLDAVQPEGRPRMDGHAWAAGWRSGER